MSGPRYRDRLESPEVLLRKDHYTPEELADLLGMTVYRIRGAARTGELHAGVVDHHVLCISREDVLRWLEDRRPSP